jgi:hypothetical protein
MGRGGGVRRGPGARRAAASKRAGARVRLCPGARQGAGGAPIGRPIPQAAHVVVAGLDVAVAVLAAAGEGPSEPRNEVPGELAHSGRHSSSRRVLGRASRGAASARGGSVAGLGRRGERAPARARRGRPSRRTPARSPATAAPHQRTSKCAAGAANKRAFAFDDSRKGIGLPCQRSAGSDRYSRQITRHRKTDPHLRPHGPRPPSPAAPGHLYHHIAAVDPDPQRQQHGRQAAAR